MLDRALQTAVQNLSMCDVHGGSTSLCLRCGKVGAGRVCDNGCHIAKFCSRQCEQTALASHKGACSTARDVKGRRAINPTPEEQDKLQALLGLVGRHLNPLHSTPGQADSVLHYLRQHPELLQQRLADYLFLCCEKLHKDRVCCNPHIYCWCLLDGCLRAGNVMQFAQNVGLSANEAPDSPLSAEQSRQRFTDWQRSTVLPLQEMFGQVGIGRFWEKSPALLADAGNSRSLDAATSSCSRSSLDLRDGASSFPPGRRSIDFRGVPSVVAVRSGVEPYARPSSGGRRSSSSRQHDAPHAGACSAARSTPSVCRPPLSRNNSTQPDGLV